ncbi:unnamed protein product [Didymodactylos carnosus]|uniref:Uncharacterized protein n=1 Tax=Didymodactylos carnosus TaxID=1234261 RepID=A0A815QXS4_9BILA|nr:unnamed protein product [Didymodactylos carnosus]CAF1469354.1 unnamed protein product [Didymodactylos carnosus]CAF4203503.1 unnamed protein product [Didymodactylos carnosus]CAF4337613.1 unnamed protein product [Didymodactylos carnosus]
MESLAAAAAVVATVSSYVKTGAEVLTFLTSLQKQPASLEMKITWPEKQFGPIVLEYHESWSHRHLQVVYNPPEYACFRNHVPSKFKTIDIKYNSQSFSGHFHAKFHNRTTVKQSEIIDYLKTAYGGYKVSCQQTKLHEYEFEMCDVVGNSCAAWFTDWQLTFVFND